MQCVSIIHIMTPRNYYLLRSTSRLFSHKGRYTDCHSAVHHWDRGGHFADQLTAIALPCSAAEELLKSGNMCWE